MNKSFKHLLYFHFLNFILYSKNSNSGTPTTTGFSFTDFLKKMINNQKIKKKTFIEKINKIIEDKNLSKYLEEIKEIIKFFKLEHQDDNLNLGVREDDFKEEEIKKIQENLQTDEGEEEQNEEEGDNEDFNFYDLEGNVIILYYYSEFKAQKNIPPKSIETEQIIDYFTMKNMNTNLREEDAQLIEETQKKEIEQQTLNNKIDSISKRMEEFYLKYKEEKVKEENLDNLQKYINSSIGILKTSKLLYIPMLGVSNAGKSTILNGIIGSRILPAQKNECTKKGILIKHWEKNYPVIRKTKFKIEKLGKDDIYYFESDKDIIAKGIEKIHRVLEGTNGEFSSKEEDFFYEIDINIKFVNDLKIDESLKEKICFIDLPGFGTNNEFEKAGVYSHLMKSCRLLTMS
jgi:GTP-binding protein EngB required for normal cell division